MPSIDAISQGQSGPVTSSQSRHTGLAIGISLVSHLALAIAITQTQSPVTLPVSLAPPPPTLALQLTQAPATAQEEAAPTILNDDSHRVIASSGASIHSVTLPEPELAPKPKPEPIPDPEPEPEPIPEAEQEPEPAPEPKPQPEAAQETVPVEAANPISSPLPAISEPTNNTSTASLATAPGDASAASQQQAELREQLYDTYLAALMQELRRSFDYPRGALRRRQEGRVQIALRIETDGTIAGITLDSSSGYNLLDESAIAMIERISGLPALPVEAGNRGLAVSVPIDFKLN